MEDPVCVDGIINLAAFNMVCIQLFHIYIYLVGENSSSGVLDLSRVLD